jgi:DNA repair photolyase
MMAHTHGRVNTYAEWCNPGLVINAEELLKKELSRMRKKPDEIHLCLTTDPFMNDYPEVTEMSLKLISLINSYGISCSLLTKGKLPSDLADRTCFPEENTHGISLVSLDEEFRKKWEPNTVSYSERICALKYLHDSGRRTYVHMEPYPTPNILRQDLEEILRSVEFVDEIWFGRWNYNNQVKQFQDFQMFYGNQVAFVSHFCKEHNIQCSL